MQNRSHDTLAVWCEETGRDRRNTRWAVLAAVGFHALFFRLELPETAAAERVRQDPPIHFLRETRFEPPPPRRQELLPEPRALRVPVPDPTPDDPEPLPAPEKVDLALDLPDTDLVLGLPKTPPPEPSPGPMRVGGDVLPPVKIYSPPPRYTEIARTARIQGLVIVEAIIDAAGRVEEVTLIKGLSMGLGEASLEAVRGWRFEPATLNGRPVAVIYRLQIHFTLT